MDQIAGFSFRTAGEIIFGRGRAMDPLAGLALSDTRVLLVRGANPARSAAMRAGLVAQGCLLEEFVADREPDLDLIDKGIKAARAFGAERVVALGGGSVIDTAKAIAALVPAERPMLDHLEVVGKGLPLEIPPLPCVALPTTAGTGAEVTRNAVIAVPEHRRKVSLRDPKMLPRLAVIDPALTDGTPRDVTLASGLDAITQVIEPYICARSNPMTDALCRVAIPQGLRALHCLITGAETPEARDALCWTSLCGGMALANAGLGVIHGLAGPLGGVSGAAHGAICGALLPHGLAMNAARISDPARLQRFDEIRGWIAGVLDCAPQDAFAALAHWQTAAGLPGLAAQGVQYADLRPVAEAAAVSSSMKANPVALGPDDLCQVMEAAF